MSPDAVTCRPIGHIRSPFAEKFGIPRQPGLAPAARAVLELAPPYDDPAALEGLEAFSHVWILFHFHATAREDWKPTVRPPRLGGNRRVGVFASRSMFRPNPVGLSVVELERVERDGRPPRLHLRGVDLLDGTPVFDIKPYLPWADAIPGARAGYAGTEPRAERPVRFTPAAQAQLETLAAANPDLPALIRQVLALDPRPAYQSDPAREYGMRLAGVEIRWWAQGEGFEVLALEPVPET